MDDLTNNINVYRRIVLNCMDSYRRCEENMKSCNSICMGDDGIQFSYELHEKMYELSTQIIVFSTLAVEAFANDFLVSNLEKKDFEMLDKLDIKGKILIGTKLVTQKDFPTDRESYSKLLKLISVRNKLVHAKPYAAYSDSSKIYFRIDKKEVEDAIETFELIVKEISNLKPELNLIKNYLTPDEKLRTWYYLHA